MNTHMVTAHTLTHSHTHTHTHVHDEEVQPAPVVGEVLLEAVRRPLEEHLQHEDVGEHLVGVLQHHLHHLPLLDVDVFKSLEPRH